MAAAAAQAAGPALYACTKCTQRYPFEELGRAGREGLGLGGGPGEGGQGGAGSWGRLRLEGDRDPGQIRSRERVGSRGGWAGGSQDSGEVEGRGRLGLPEVEQGEGRIQGRTAPG
ncbi:hypothetical protein LUU34_00723900 [Aix galericulata]|nr:hypothetical protein LUU34_00723900 [Aix galericulata]